MHWMTNRNRRYGVAIVKENCFETQPRRIYKVSPVQRTVINIECLHQAINQCKQQGPFPFSSTELDIRAFYNWNSDIFF